MSVSTSSRRRLREPSPPSPLWRRRRLAPLEPLEPLEPSLHLSDVAFFDQAREELLCGVCKNLMVQCYSASCGHGVCLDCLQSQRILSHSQVCPICRGCPLSSFIPCKIISFMVAKLDRKCQSCKGLFTLGLEGKEFLKHHDTCPLIAIKCSECPFLFKRGELRDHQDMHRKCHICDFTQPDFNQSDHLKLCLYFPRDCPRQCGEKIGFINMQNHLNHTCPLKTVKCTVCDATVARRFIDGHHCNTNAFAWFGRARVGDPVTYLESPSRIQEEGWIEKMEGNKIHLRMAGESHLRIISSLFLKSKGVLAPRLGDSLPSNP
jgi:hypothetical protein